MKPPNRKVRSCAHNRNLYTAVLHLRLAFQPKNDRMAAAINYLVLQENTKLSGKCEVGALFPFVTCNLLSGTKPTSCHRSCAALLIAHLNTQLK